MAFRFGDPGGRLYNAVGTSNVNQLAWWNGVNSSTSIFTIVSSGGRTGGNALRYSTSAGGYVTKVLDNQATWGIAFALKTGSTLSTATVPFLGFTDAGVAQIDLRIKTDGTIVITRAGTILGTTSIALTLNVWAHIEWLTTIHPSAGTVQIWINGVLALNLTSQNTRSTANSSANAVWIGDFPNVSAAGTFTFDFDDIIVYDGQANDPAGNPDIHGQIGDCGLAWLLPSGAGTTTQFTADSGSNYARVSEATPDGDTSYVEDSTVGHIDTYALTDLSATAASVKSLALVSYARKTDVGSRGMKHEIRTNSTNVAHTTEIALSDSYLYYMSTWGQNPTGTPANWTVANVNALEIGRQVSS